MYCNGNMIIMSYYDSFYGLYEKGLMTSGAPLYKGPFPASRSMLIAARQPAPGNGNI